MFVVSIVLEDVSGQIKGLVKISVFLIPENELKITLFILITCSPAVSR